MGADIPLMLTDTSMNGGQGEEPFCKLCISELVSIDVPLSEADSSRVQFSSKRRRAQTTATTPLHSSTDSSYQPLRIAFDTSDLRSQMELSLSAGDTLAATKLFLLIYEILPSTAEVWGDILRVIPVVGGIYPLDAVGSSVDVILPNDTDDETECTGEHSVGPN